MIMFDLHSLVRENVKHLVPYSSARDEFTGKADVYIDANENSLGSPLTRWYNRYPDPHHQALKAKLGTIKGVSPKHIFIGNGSDEAIDILYRVFCVPAKDNVIICPPTYGMYEVSAHINDVELRKVELIRSFQLDLEALERAIDGQTKMIWLCSPNNPTGNVLDRADVEMVLNNFEGIVVVDEAYINFSRQRSLIPDLADYPNLVILQTLSKAWGLAALRLGMAFASPEIIDFMNRVKPPYNINQATQELALLALDEVDQVNDMIRLLVEEREKLTSVLSGMRGIRKVHVSDTNFLLVEMEKAHEVYRFLLDKGIVVRDRSKTPLCEDCLRITVGTPAENQKLINALMAFSFS
jgi:histidinol-phosphate aminotransferase